MALWLRSLLGLFQVSPRSLRYIPYIVGQTEPKILRLVCLDKISLSPNFKFQ